MVTLSTEATSLALWSPRSPIFSCSFCTGMIYFFELIWILIIFRLCFNHLNFQAVIVIIVSWLSSGALISGQGINLFINSWYSFCIWGLPSTLVVFIFYQTSYKFSGLSGRNCNTQSSADWQHRMSKSPCISRCSFIVSIYNNFILGA